MLITYEPRVTEQSLMTFNFRLQHLDAGATHGQRHENSGVGEVLFIKRTVISLLSMSKAFGKAEDVIGKLFFHQPSLGEAS